MQSVHVFLRKKLFAKLLMLLVLLGSVSWVDAGDLTGSNFIIRDPVVGTGGVFGTSTNFNLYGSGDMTMLGEATSTSFASRYGFLYYPYVTQGAFTATPTGSQVDLAWGASTAGLGWSVSGYKTGIATVSGGPYTYTSVGNVTSYSYTGLTPGQYCFVLQTLDAFSNVIATSGEQCATVQAVVTFSVSDAAVSFGALTSGGPRYATTSGGDAK